MQHEEKARQNLEAQVLDRVAKDLKFREQLKQDPRSTASRGFGVQVPQDISVEVVEETPTKVYLVLPAGADVPALDEGALHQRKPLHNYSSAGTTVTYRQCTGVGILRCFGCLHTPSSAAYSGNTSAIGPMQSPSWEGCRPNRDLSRIDSIERTPHGA